MEFVGLSNFGSLKPIIGDWVHNGMDSGAYLEEAW